MNMPWYRLGTGEVVGGGGASMCSGGAEVGAIGQ